MGTGGWWWHQCSSSSSSSRAGAAQGGAGRQADVARAGGAAAWHGLRGDGGPAFWAAGGARGLRPAEDGYGVGSAPALGPSGLVPKQGRGDGVAQPHRVCLQRRARSRRCGPTSWAPRPSRCSGSPSARPAATAWSGKEPQVGFGAPRPRCHPGEVAAHGDAALLPAGPEPPRTVSLPSSVSSYQLTGLQPGTEYRITLYTLYDGGEVATPVTTFQTGERMAPGMSPASLAVA